MARSKDLLFNLDSWRREYPEDSFRTLLEELRVELGGSLPGLPVKKIRFLLDNHQARLAGLLQEYPELSHYSSYDPERPEEQEYALCKMVVPLLRLQIERRARKVSPQPGTPENAPAPPENPARITKHDPELAKRVAIVRQNREVGAQGVCTLFDDNHVPLPRGWIPQTWARAYKSLEFRSRIQVIISKDKKRSD